MTARRHSDVLARGRLGYDALQRRIALLRRHFGLESDRAVYLALAALQQRRSMSSLDDGPLGRYELRCFSQNGEDGVLAEILARIGAVHRFFVEFGIQDGQEGNCVLLADVEGWNGLFIEANRADHERLAAKYAATPAIEAVNAYVSPDNIEQLLRDARVPPDFDVLSIDIDGQDYWVWEAVGSHAPRVVVIEYNSALPPDRRWVQPRGLTASWDHSDYIGSSLAALEQLAFQKGYVLVHTELTGLNAFFVRADLADGKFPAPELFPRWVRPNYHLQGVRYLPDPHGRPYVDLDSEA